MLAVLAVPAANAATTDTAAPVTVSPALPGPYQVDQEVVFDSPTVCTVSCQRIWTLFKAGGPHLGQRMAVDTTEVAWKFTAPGIYTVQFDLSEFCVGTTRLTCDSSAQVTLSVGVAPPPPGDSTPPTITASNLVAEAMAPETVVSYQVQSPDPDAVSVSCTPGPGQAFPVGATPIDCTANDTSGNVGHASFMVSVTDRTPPALSVPAALSVAATSPAGAAVSFAASATDLVDGAVAPVCSMPSGMTFPVGSTLVACTATDNHQNTATASFEVSVAPFADPTPASPPATPPASPPATPPATPPASPPAAPTPPATVNVTPPALAVPTRPIVVNATSSAGAIVRYSVLATDAAGARVDARCSRASATLFPIGSTTVSCTAIDAHGNAAPASLFTVRVKGAPVQLADALAEVRSWKARSAALPGRLQQVGKALAARPQRACLLLGSLRRDLRGPLGTSVSPAHRAWLRAELARIAAVASC